MDIDPLHLSEEELNYELALRNIRELGQKTRRVKCSTLLKAFEEDLRLGRSHLDSTHVMNNATNIDICQSRVRLLLTPIDTAIKKHDIGFLEHAKSRLHHYRDRLERINPPDELRNNYENIQAVIFSALDDVRTALDLSNIVQADGYSVHSVRANVASDTLQVEQINNNTGQLQHLERERNSISQAHGAAIVRQTGAISKNMQGQWINKQQQDTTSTTHPASRKSEVAGLPIASSPVSKGRGRGRQATTVSPVWHPRLEEGHCDDREQNIRDYSSTFGIPKSPPPPPYQHIVSRLENRRSSFTAGNRLYEEHANQTTAPRMGDRRIDESAEFNRLRDEMLTYLLRRERNQQEGPRNPKAIHNWPFKFRGEKDTTSLNTFLDRVECFARSEGIAEELLLRSVKHLLLDDALDWYGRAFTEGTLGTWSDFKEQIRREFLPSSYSQILRNEANDRHQGVNESFAKFYRDISTLFRFIHPPMSAEEKFFMVKKNINAEYASIVAAARPRTLKEIAEVCNEFDETRVLLNRHRRAPIPHHALLEPNFATPPAPQKERAQGGLTPYHPFGRVHTMEAWEDSQVKESYSVGDNTSTSPLTVEDHTWSQQIDTLCQQVNALRGRFERRDQRYNSGQGFRPPQTAHRQQAVQVSDSVVQGTQQQAVSQYQRNVEQTGQATLRCWNCEEDGHRFMDCPKPQAILFCYRCGQKGYSLRSCPTCSSTQGNEQARSQ